MFAIFKRFIKILLQKIIFYFFNIINFFIPEIISYKFFDKKINVYENKKKIFSLRNYSPTCKWRAQTFLTKEIDTISWINSFNENDVFLDVGANIGIYSLYAANKLSKVWSIEPESLNFAMLNLNINDNGLASKITAIPLSLHKNMKIDKLNIRNLDWGEALNSFETAKDQFGKKFKPNFTQGSFSTTLDNIIKMIGKIDHIKIDVDGNEEYIIEGGYQNIKERTFKSILIELDEKLSNYKSILDKIEINGYVLKSKTASSFYTEIFGSTKNHIFYRE